jgi:hypothetical protein
LSSDGKIVCIGAYLGNYVTIYEYDGANWNQLGTQLNGSGSYGYSVSISDDGNIVGIGAISGTGKVEIFEFLNIDPNCVINDANKELKIENIDTINITNSNSTSLNIKSIDALVYDTTDLKIGTSSNPSQILCSDITNSVIINNVEVENIKGVSSDIQINGVSQINNDTYPLTIGTNSNIVLNTGGDVVIRDINGPDATAESVKIRTDTKDFIVIDSVNDEVELLQDVSVSVNNELKVENINAIDSLIKLGKRDEIWEQLGEDIDGKAAGDWSGFSTSISNDGKIVAVGGTLNDDIGTESGLVRVYNYDGLNWNQIGNDITGLSGDKSGVSISISGDGTILAIGSYFHDSERGTARIYQYNGISTWNQIGQDLDGQVAGDRAGTSVSISNDGLIVAVGSPKHDSIRGTVRVYQYDGISTWNPLGGDIDGDNTGDWFGISVSLSSDGSIVAIGAFQNDDNGTLSGHAQIYEYDGISSWNKVGQTIVGENANDRSGQSVSISNDGKIVAIGATSNDGNGSDSGHCRVYQYDGISNWNQLGSDIDGEAAGDKLGIAVNLSGDGKIVAIGIFLSDGNGTDSGAGFVYQYDGSNWNKVGQTIYGEGAGDSLGRSISISDDGSIFSIGGYLNDDNGIDSGHAQIYEIIGNVMTIDDVNNKTTISNLQTGLMTIEDDNVVGLQIKTDTKDFIVIDSANDEIQFLQPVQGLDITADNLNIDVDLKFQNQTGLITTPSYQYSLPSITGSMVVKQHFNTPITGGLSDVFYTDTYITIAITGTTDLQLRINDFGLSTQVYARIENHTGNRANQELFIPPAPNTISPINPTSMGNGDVYELWVYSFDTPVQFPFYRFDLLYHTGRIIGCVSRS